MSTDSGGFAGYNPPPSPPPPPNFNCGEPMFGFMNEVARTLSEQPDCRFMSSHALENHGGHGPHSQIILGMGRKGENAVNVNIRQLLEDLEKRKKSDD